MLNKIKIQQEVVNVSIAQKLGNNYKNQIENIKNEINRVSKMRQIGALVLDKVAIVYLQWQRKLTEIDSIPSGLTFKEFDLFVNDFDNVKRKTV